VKPITAFLAMSVVFLTSAPALADNFQFAVAAEEGLSLVITGYGRDGSQMFQSPVAGIENYKGKDYYIVRIDGDVIRSKRLGEWCVEDKTGQWSLLPADVKVKILCDNRPRETAGTYTFTSRREVSSAGSPMQCVQNQLNELGFPAGPADGKLGSQTVQAAKAYIAYMKANAEPGWAMAVVTKSTAKHWCEKVAEAHPKVAKFWDAIK
jgi:hypothetical protein